MIASGPRWSDVRQGTARPRWNVMAVTVGAHHVGFERLISHDSSHSVCCACPEVSYEADAVSYSLVFLHFVVSTVQQLSWELAPGLATTLGSEEP